MSESDSVANKKTWKKFVTTLVYFIVQNYCGNPCSDYFAFIERSVGYFHMDQQKQALCSSVHKRFIISSSNTEGVELAIHSRPKLFLKSRKYGKQSIAGDILESAVAKADLDAILTENSPGK